MLGLSRKNEAPVLNNKDGKVFVSSLDIADNFGKQHKNIIRDVENIECTPEFSELNFEPTSYLDKSNRESKCYNITRDGFSFLVMGFTGKKAAIWKEKYIEAFNKIEAELKNTPAPQLSPDEIVQQALLIQGEKVKKLETKIEQDKPKVEFYDACANKDGLYNLRNAGRAICETPNKFISWLKQSGYLFYEGKKLVPYAKYRQQGLFEVKVVHIDEKEYAQTYVTPKGLRSFQEKWSNLKVA